VPHAHIHLIPIQKESDMSLANPRLKLSEEEFREIAEAIRQAFLSSI
ncbi:MAG: HIT family protein, partial [Dysgonamonadaceae bacterium]|jgi:histidine triad (HIT) family protein